MKRVILNDVVEIISGGTPKTSKLEYWGGNIPWLSVKDFNNDKRYAYQTEKSITEEGLNHSAATLLQKDDIVISARGTVGAITMVPFPMTFNQSCYGLRAKNGVDQVFLYYCVKNAVEILKGITHGSVFDTITRDTFKNVEVLIPSYNEQRKIADMLSDIDDKIELNDRINKNLVQQAQAIYVDMFITNDDPSWPLGHLSDLIAVKYGKDHKKLNDGLFPVYGSGGIMRYVERPLYDKESVLIPRKGTLNNVMYVNEPFWSVDTMFFTEMKLPDVAKFVFHFVKSKDLASLNAGSAVPSMTTDILNAMELHVPDTETLKQFENIVSPMYRAIQHNTEESKNLAKVRDSLLPRLMSGELDVSGFDL